MYSPDETRAIGEWALTHNLLVVTDEIYQNLTYDGVQAISIVEAVPELASNTILVNGVAKTYAMTGWRIGWMIAPADIAKGAANLQSHMTSNINNVAQIAAAEALNGSQDAVEEMRQAFDRRRKIIVAELNKVPGFVCPNPEGAFYAYADVSAVFGTQVAGTVVTSSLELADLILDKAEVAAVPGEAFGRSGYLRFSYALGDDALLEGIQRIQKLLTG